MNRDEYLNVVADLLALETRMRVTGNGTVREKSLSEQQQTRRLPGYYELYCIHDVHKWCACRKCGRSQRVADKVREAYLLKLAAIANNTHA